jgi:hypothetical protein
LIDEARLSRRTQIGVFRETVSGAFQVDISARVRLESRVEIDQTIAVDRFVQSRGDLHESLFADLADSGFRWIVVVCALGNQADLEQAATA